MSVTTRATALGFAGCVLLLACGGNGSGGGGGGGGGTCDNIEGTWTGSAQVDASACGQGTYTESGPLVITQAAGSCSISVAYYSYGSMSGSVSGSDVTFSGSYPKFSGTVTLDQVNLVVSTDQTTISGTITWTYKGGALTCGGSTAISGTKETST